MLVAGAVVSAQEPPAEVPADAIRTVMDLVFVVEDIDIKVSETEAEIRLTLTADILFDFDEATINPIAFETLQRVAEEIRMRPGLARVSKGTPMAGGPMPTTRICRSDGRRVYEAGLSVKGSFRTWCSRPAGSAPRSR